MGSWVVYEDGEIWNPDLNEFNIPPDRLEERDWEGCLLDQQVEAGTFRDFCQAYRMACRQAGIQRVFIDCQSG